MYTQCPDCHIAFRVTAQVLQKAGGRVRCGGCGNAFSAIDYLSEQLPVPAGGGAPGDVAAPAETGSQASDSFAAKSAALLKELNQLAGSENIRIEDTGFEWRVLEDEDEQEIVSGVAESLDDTRIGAEQSGDGVEQRSLNLHDAPREERRYDDNTPLPDDFEDEVDEPYIPPTPQRRAEDHDADIDFDTHQIDLAMGEEADDWADLLDDEDAAAEVFPDSATTGMTEIPLEVEEELAAIHNELLASAAALRPQPGADQFEAPQEPVPEAQAESNEVVDEFEPLDGPAEHDMAQAVVEPEDIEEAAGLELLEASGEFEVLEASGEFEVLEASGEFEVLETPAGSESTEVSREHDEPEPAAADDHQFDDYEEDELTPDQEADIVGKLRESTGAFQKQIEAAQQALDQGDIDFYKEPHNEPDDEPDDEPEVELHDHAEDDEPTDGEALDKAGDAGAEADDEIDEEAAPEPELLFDEAGDETPDELATRATDDQPEDSAAVEDDEELSHEDRLAHTMRMAGIDPADLEGANVETIIMEGTQVRDDLERELEADAREAISKLEDPGFLADTYMDNKGKLAGGRRRSDPPAVGAILGVAGLALLLAAQWVHNSRESLATYGFFNQTLGPVYRAVGKPVTPEWDIKGWRFLNTRGSADENNQLLTIFSSISNASAQPLPYPLVHVSLTDRYEEIIGSKALEPGEYLAGDLDPSRPVAAGDQFRAVIAIESPPAEAVGFKLNVCYRLAPGRLRCATEDFKD